MYKLLKVLVSIAVASLISGCQYIDPAMDEVSFWNQKFYHKLPELNDHPIAFEFDERWSVKTGLGNRIKYLKLTPKLDGETMFSAHHNGVIAAHHIYTSDELWRTKIDDEITGGPSLGYDHLYIGTSSGKVLAFDKTTGEQLWSAQLSSEVLAEPRYSDGYVLGQTVDGKLHALDSETGNKAWIYDREAPILNLRGSSSPVIYEGVVFSGFANGKLVALDLKTGRPYWERKVAVGSGRTEIAKIVDIDADPVIHDQTLYTATYQGNLTAIDLNNGATKWHKKTSSHAGLAVDDNVLVVAEADGKLKGYDPDSGLLLWEQAHLVGRNITTPVLWHHFVLVGDEGGYCHLLSKVSGRPVSRVLVDRKGLISPATTNEEAIFLSGNSGVIKAYLLMPINSESAS